MSVAYRNLDPAQARAAAEELSTVYTAVFTQPPYNEPPSMAAKFMRWVSEESQLPGFAMVVACDEGPIGFAYGYTQAAADWFRNADQPAPTDAADTDRYAVMEWAVLPDCRGQGVGAELMRRLLDGRPEQYAVLTVNPAAEARAIYERAGWRHVASTAPSRSWPGMHVMILNRRSSSAAGR